MNNLEIIKEQEVLGKEFRIYGDIENPLFLAKDVANWIEHSNLTMMLRNIDEDEQIKIRPKQSLGLLTSNNEYNFLTEDGLYEILMQSRKPIAKAFKKEVKAILKSIRKHGAYMTENTLEKALSDSDFLIQLATNLKEEQNKRKLAEDKARKEQINRIAAEQEVKEKNVIIDTIINDEGLYAIKTVGKVLKGYNNIDFGANKIFDFMRENKILMNKKHTQDHNLPYDRYGHYFNIKYVNIKRFNNSYSEPKAYFNRKGLKWFLRYLVKYGYITNEDSTQVANILQ